MPPDVNHSGPQLCFGEVRHARLRPALNAFRYGVCYLRLPMRTLGQDGFGLRLMSRNRFNLLSFHDSDHGDGSTPLTAWLDALLAQHGIHDADGEAWLQTFPRVLGYVFNPVSFWFCHRKDGALRAVLCDVHNTFGERHLYLLDTGAAIGQGQLLTAQKVFHVSPFCPREGRYVFRFARRGRRTLARIDYETESGPLLQTSVTGLAQALDDGAAARALLRYPLMTFGVLARIHWQALKLWRKRLPFFSKPDPILPQVSR